jgi:hypothetical protein
MPPASQLAEGRHVRAQYTYLRCGYGLLVLADGDGEGDGDGDGEGEGEGEGDGEEDAVGPGSTAQCHRVSPENRH